MCINSIYSTLSPLNTIHRYFGLGLPLDIRFTITIVAPCTNNVRICCQVAGSENDLDDQLKDPIGMGIVRNCDGLPLAIKVVGGLLRTKRVNKREWTSVLENPAWS